MYWQNRHFPRQRQSKEFMLVAYPYAVSEVHVGYMRTSCENRVHWKLGYVKLYSIS